MDGQTDRQTDRQTDGIDVASTALAMRALRRAVKMLQLLGTKSPDHKNLAFGPDWGRPPPGPVLSTPSKICQTNTEFSGDT